MCVCVSDAIKSLMLLSEFVMWNWNWNCNWRFFRVLARLQISLGISKKHLFFFFFLLENNGLGV